MSACEDVDSRLKKSVHVLRTWQWMTTLSDRPEEAIAVLTEEARFLVQLGIANPGRVREIGKLIVAYQRLISQLKQAAERYPQAV